MPRRTPIMPSRARLSRIGAWASEQSRPLPGRGALLKRHGPVRGYAYRRTTSPGRRFWSGYRVVPARIEFWQEMPFRLHDRTVYLRAGEGWDVVKLYP